MELPGEWVEKADVFLREAKRHIEEGIYWLSCFEAQQAAELYLKALHVAAAGLYLFTHDLSELLESLKALNFNPPDDLFVIADALTAHYTLLRYPGRKPVSYTKSLAERCVSYAEKIIEWVKRVSEMEG
ncbi:MAG: HEPN domain-containing protein [Thermofilaceae archaeon]